MKLATYLPASGNGAPRIGAVDTASASILDLQAAWQREHHGEHPAFASMLALIEAGEAGLRAARETEAHAGIGQRTPLGSVRLLAPIPLPPQIRDCNNFEEHMRNARLGMTRMKARIAGQPEPAPGSVDLTPHPVNFAHIVFYISNRFTVVGPDADIEWPSYADYFDYEGEFAAIIGKPGRDIPAGRADEHIFGYTVFNDFSARDKQAEEMEGRMGPTKGKSFDTGNAMGPWIVTRDEIPDCRAMAIQVRVNGERRAAATTAGMIHSVGQMIAYISQHETLHCGEVIGSGTVGGCCGLETGRFLEDGDVVEIDIDRIGVLRNRVRRQLPAPELRTEDNRQRSSID
ncbi:Ureidoglycolate lyase [Pigmentiphaga humi]|uniref:Ureidoglycolate lyase n=1 Tax=Pigmentiphaga humi TaxID=2478468 RepID=A0A3P4B4S3_9BURK|nr:fumarylacetoacetate hydrolase family protein [Pigmentiphaga humi]VCU71052.1 Ureidoglycolate lyase [Pigmentiphaga humi]